MDHFLNSIKILLILSSLFSSLPGKSQTHDQIQKVKGSWSGKLSVQGMELTLVFNLTANDQDSITITMDSPDQGAKGIATSKVILTTDSLIVKIKSLMGSYMGAFREDYSLLTGTWKQGGMSFPLDLKYQEKPVTINRPQEPKPPFPYLQEEVIINNKQGGFDLSGTLTYPKEGAPFPVVILITGSGPQNRDEELMGHKPFLVLADHLTRNGIAVLRCDDRGVGKSGGKFSTATTLDFAEDVSAMVDFLKFHSNIDSSRVGLIGHSEGGMVTSVVASERKDIDFVILMAGPGVSGEKIILLQSALLFKSNGATDKEIEAVLKEDEEIFSILKKNKDNDKASEKIRKAMNEFNKKQPAGNGTKEALDSETDMKIKIFTSAWFRGFITLDPMKYLSHVKCPLLAINGELDMQVPPAENLEAIERAMILAGNSNYTVEMIPGLNHLFQTAPTGNPSEYGKIDETISPGVLDIITVWINKHQ
jgi:uncharacterized protein